MGSFKFLLNSKGFSLPELMIGLGIVGITSYGVMKLTDNINSTNSGAQTKNESLELKRMAVNVLVDKPSCTRTMKGVVIGAGPAHIITFSGKKIAEVGKTYGGKVKLITMDTKEKVGLTDANRIVELFLRTEPTTKINPYTKTVITIPLNVKVEGNKIIECYADNDQYMKTTCESLAGVWDGINCSLPKCPSGQVLASIDPATGVATCRNPNCSIGQLFQGIDATGNPICVYPSASKQCPAGKQVIGFDSSGEPVCDFALTNVRCPIGEILAGLDSAGNGICVPLPEGVKPPALKKCSVENKTWVASSTSCSGIIKQERNDGEFSSATSTTPEGVANYRCDAGVWTEQPGSTCTESPKENEKASCTAVSNFEWHPNGFWGVNGYDAGGDLTKFYSHCMGELKDAPHGEAEYIVEANPASNKTGSATVYCWEGQWIVKPGSTCVAKGCSAEQFTWNSSDGVTCKADALASEDGDLRRLKFDSNSHSGSAALICDNGEWRDPPLTTRKCHRKCAPQTVSSYDESLGKNCNFVLTKELSAGENYKVNESDLFTFSCTEDNTGIAKVGRMPGVCPQ